MVTLSTNQPVGPSAPNLIQKHVFLCLSPKHGFTTWLGFSKVWDLIPLESQTFEKPNQVVLCDKGIFDKVLHFGGFFLM